LDYVLLENMIKNIIFDKYFNEATFQFKLLLEIAKKYDESKIFPERNIKKYDVSGKYVKKEIDIVLEKENDLPYAAIELKMPMNGQNPEQMYKMVEDIKFLEQIKQNCNFIKCYFITVTNDKLFWTGKKNDGIYSFFRNNVILGGKINKPTGDTIHSFFILYSKYEIKWKDINNNFKYFIVEV